MSKDSVPSHANLFPLQGSSIHPWERPIDRGVPWVIYEAKCHLYQQTQGQNLAANVFCQTTFIRRKTCIFD